MPEEHLGFFLVDESAGEPGLEVLDAAPHRDVDVLVDEANAVTREIDGAKVHGARATTLRVGRLVLTLELERFDLCLDPAVGVRDVCLRELRENRVVVGDDPMDALELNDGRRHRFARQVVVPVGLERGSRAREEPCGGVSGELRDVAAAKRDDAHRQASADRRRRVE